ncbi:alternative 3-dehydroquinate synthase [Saccharopolyspora erythraea NRRL 2338]|uniref:Alternative 3-dehydroquinate synthase n=2 Tax=Saccharopolyspora erythraea TaxID=1836 RepID=A4FJW1_SACEN|nr:3-dehydroquinate synthase II [Saccharopolyspora erythraea]EQD82046.1 3-dehydroquinate synthase [Saccharopolyspora erythraea D]QRK88099.1 3-dehydroquinate synthase [Saccharopolyspora erythraea]CAM04336.1 alternative 3-dehydroquinate synthase [Saccharopolyspora erythraea NRRL 2338]
MKLCWLDIRGAGGAKDAIIEEAVHQRVDAVLSDDVADLASLPPTVTRVLMVSRGELPRAADEVDAVIVDSALDAERAEIAELYPKAEIGRFVEIVDSDTLDLACEAARTDPWSVLWFHEPTKIPLEIVLAAANNSKGGVITVARKMPDVEILCGVLERGSDGVMLAVNDVGDATEFKERTRASTPDLALVALTVTEINDVGMGDRACVDTCSYLREDEGLLIGSRSSGLVLSCSETHPCRTCRPGPSESTPAAFTRTRSRRTVGRTT